MTEEKLFQEIGAYAYVGDFRKLRSQVGFRRALKSLLVRYRYIVRLWLIRELSIWLILIKNFDKIPKWTPSKLFIGIFVRCAFLKNVIIKSVNRMQNKLTFNT